MNEMLSGDFPQPTLPDPADMPTVDDLVGAVRRAERRSGSLVTCANCGWSCRCTSDSLALEEAETHEAQDPAAQIVFHHEVTS